MRPEDNAQHNWMSSTHNAVKLRSLTRPIGEQYEHDERVDTWSTVPIPQYYQELSLTAVIQGHKYGFRVERSDGFVEETRVTVEEVKKFLILY